MNTPQSEQSLENQLIEQLQSLEYEYVKITDEPEILKNLKAQLEKHNYKNLSGEKEFSEKEFEKILNHLSKGSIFERAKILRGKMQLTRDNGTTEYIDFLNSEHWCQNEYQVTNQITMEGSYKNRYDVTLLINGLPLVQIELKRRGLELKEAFNQTGRYHKHSFWAGHGLFQYIQMFVISNGVNTKYYANNKGQSFKQTFFWADEENKHIPQLMDFAQEFLEPCHLSKMIAKYTVLNETEKILMVLRPYQYYAVEAIIKRVQETNQNGYIWHTTGSGKTLTSFKASQILMKLPEVNKVVFVVDRKDLDYQTTKEFNSFSKGSIDGTDNTRKLVQQFENTDTKLIVTTIQKLNTAILKPRYLEKMEALKDKKVIFIFDECHRSQFGETHKRIKNFFNNHQMFGFTGTPIFADNNNGNKTTKDLFDKQLHSYVITDAIKDENVLKFSIEYVGKYREKSESKNNIDIEVEDIDTKELLESPERSEKIVDYILAHHKAKTHYPKFTAMMCVSSVDMLIQYYDIFRRKDHNLNIATIFSYGTNEDDKSADGYIGEIALDVKDSEVNTHSRDKLEEYIGDYNKTFNTKFTTKDSKSFYNYYNDIAKKVKQQKIDILLVVNMFLTGFDSKTLNTLYVDKNLRYHGLIQAFSRTNRILNETKSQGNIVCFRNLKKNVDEAITLFANKNAKEVVVMESMEHYIKKCNELIKHIYYITPTVDVVSDLSAESEQLEFVKLFRDLLRTKNILSTFTDFSFEMLDIDEQDFEDYKSKYLDLYRSTKQEKEKVSVLEEVDFELELIGRDNITIDYIISLLSQLVDENNQRKKESSKQSILNLIGSEPKLMSKKALIQQFIEENLPHIQNSEDVSEAFETYFNEQREAELDEFCKEEGLEKDKLQKILSNYLYTGVKPLRDEIAETMKQKPKLLERTTILKRIFGKMMDFVERFEEI